jgi:hypothetical protein
VISIFFIRSLQCLQLKSLNFLLQPLHRCLQRETILLNFIIVPTREIVAVEKSLSSYYTVRFVFPFLLFSLSMFSNCCWNCFIVFCCCVVSATLLVFFLDCFMLHRANSKSYFLNFRIFLVIFRVPIL